MTFGLIAMPLTEINQLYGASEYQSLLGSNTTSGKDIERIVT